MKTDQQLSKEYENDPRWKKVKELTMDMNYQKAAYLSNEIIDSYPAHVRNLVLPEDKKEENVRI